MSIARVFPHSIGFLRARINFPARTLNAIEQAIADGERTHDGQVCVAIENALHWRDLLRSKTPRQAAEHAFARLRVWDTRDNSGVLIYVLVADRAIEIVADRGISARVPASDWQVICDRIQARFAAREFENGLVDGVRDVSALLAQHFPPRHDKLNELPDQPVRL